MRMRLGIFAIVVVFSITLLFTGSTRAAEVDTSFGSGGTVVYETGSTYRPRSAYAGQPHALALDTQGRILVGGGYDNTLLLLRYLPTGSLDSTFGMGGVVKLGPEYLWGHPDVTVRRIETINITHDGSIMVTWTNHYGGTQYRLMKLFADGSVDVNFGSKRGKYIGTPRIPSDAFALPGGSMLIGGAAFYEPGLGFITKLRSDGDHDHNFGTKGSGNLSFRSRNSRLNSSVENIFLTNGKVVASGNQNSRFLLARVTANGRLDRSFGRSVARRKCSRKRVRGNKRRYRKCVGKHSGKVYTDFLNVAGPNCAYNMAAGITQRGDIVQAGYRCKYFLKESADRLLMAKHHADGSVARGFGNNGKLALPVKPLVTPRSIAIQKNGKILLALWKGYYDRSLFGLFRFLPNGRLDKSFFGNGKYVRRIGDAVSTADRVVIDSEGRAVVAGGAADFKSGTDEIGGGSFVIRRFLLGN